GTPPPIPPPHPSDARPSVGLWSVPAPGRKLFTAGAALRPQPHRVGAWFGPASRPAFTAPSIHRPGARFGPPEGERSGPDGGLAGGPAVDPLEALDPEEGLADPGLGQAPGGDRPPEVVEDGRAGAGAGGGALGD